MFEQNSLGRERPTDLGRLSESFSVASVSFVVDLGMMNSLIRANSIMDALREGYASQLIQYYQHIKIEGYKPPLEGFTIRIGGEYVNEEGWDLNKLEDGATELNVSLGQIYISVLEGIREQFLDNKDLADQMIKQDSFGQAIDQMLLQRIIAGLDQYAASGEHELTIGANSSETPSTPGIVVTTTQGSVDQSLNFAQVALGYHE